MSNNEAPKIVRVSREVFMAIKAIHEGFGKQTNREDLLAILGQDISDASKEAGDWFRDKWHLYVRGCTAGFEIKRYRLSLEYADGTRNVLREGEDKDAIQRYTNELVKGWQTNKYVVKPNIFPANAKGALSIYQSDGITKHCDLNFCLVTDSPLRQSQQKDPVNTDPEPEPTLI